MKFRDFSNRNSNDWELAEWAIAHIDVPSNLGFESQRKWIKSKHYPYDPDKRVALQANLCVLLYLTIKCSWLKPSILSLLLKSHVLYVRVTCSRVGWEITASFEITGESIIKHMARGREEDTGRNGCGIRGLFILILRNGPDARI